MYGLRSWLETKGQEVYMNATAEDKNFVAIYPEIYPPTNESGARTVVRYILNKPGTMGLYGKPGPTDFDPNDRIYYFSKLFGKAENEDHYLFLPILDTFVFRDQHRKRTKTCVFIGKGNNKMHHPKDAIFIDRVVAQDQQKLADILNECEVMYGYDPVSAMYEIARLCGCRVVLIQDEYEREEWMNYEPGMNGISWDKDEGVRLDVDGFTKHYAWLRVTFSKKLNRFIKDTQK